MSDGPNDPSDGDRSDGVPPPPGGYGLHDPPKPARKEPKEPKERKAKAAPEPPPAVSTFRNAAPFEGVPISPPPSRRWVGVPIVGIAILALRFMLLCARTSTPSYSYDPIYVPPAIPSYDWEKDLPKLDDPRAEQRVGPIAVDDQGTAYFAKKDDLYKQTNGGVPSIVALGEGRQLRAIGLRKGVPYWLGPSGVSRLAGDEPETVLVGSYLAMAIDGDDAYLVSSDGDSLQRVSLASQTATPVTVAKVTTTAGSDELYARGVLAVDATYAYVGTSEGVARVAKKGANQVISAAWAKTDANALAVDKGTVYASSEEGIVAIAKNGTKTVLQRQSETSSTVYAEVAVAGDDVYFVELASASEWRVKRAPKKGGDAELIVTTLAEPHLVSRRGSVYWDTASGVGTSTAAATRR